MNLLGFNISRAPKDNREDEFQSRVSFTEPAYDDGAINVSSINGYATGGVNYGTSIDIENNIRSEAELINKYRSMALQPEIRDAVEEIVTAAMAVNAHDKVVEINMDGVEGLSLPTKEKISREFSKILNLMNFPYSAYDIFKRWYIDGRINMHIIIDEQNLKKGIQEIRYVDPRKIKLIREFEEVQSKEVPGAVMKRVKNEYYIYTELQTVNDNITMSYASASNGLRIAKDSIVRVTSGEMNPNGTMVISFLHSAIKPLNSIRMLEDAKIIYTLTRAPDRKAFYVDVGNLPPAKAQQYMDNIMNKHKSKTVYDSATGEIKDDRQFITMTQDYWFPRRGGNRITEVDVMSGGSQLADNDDLSYYLNRLYKSLQVPNNRLEPESMYAFGRPSEISREEVKFSRFIARLRARFSSLFSECLGRQLVLKGIILPNDWEIIKSNIRFDFMSDNFFEEMKEIEILREKMTMLADVDAQVGKYFSREWVFKNILYMTEEEREEMLKQIDKEKKDGLYDEEFGGVAVGDDTDNSEFIPQDEDEEDGPPKNFPPKKEKEESDDKKPSN